MQDTFIDAIDQTTTMEAIEDGTHVILNISTGSGIALTPAQAHALADTLHALAAGL